MMGGKGNIFTFECQMHLRKKVGKSASEEAIVCQASKSLWSWLKDHMSQKFVSVIQPTIMITYHFHTEGQEQMSQFVQERLLSSAGSSGVGRCFAIGGLQGYVFLWFNKSVHERNHLVRVCPNNMGGGEGAPVPVASPTPPLPTPLVVIPP